jgi:hypothetical protein
MLGVMFFRGCFWIPTFLFEGHYKSCSVTKPLAALAKADSTVFENACFAEADKGEGTQTPLPLQKKGSRIISGYK